MKARQQIVHYYEQITAHAAAITAVIAAHDAISSYSELYWLKPIMQGACVDATRLRTPIKEIPVDLVLRSESKRAEEITYQAFSQLTTELRKPRFSGDYNTEPVAPRKLARGGHAERRYLCVLDFIDCVHSQHPLNAELALLLDRLETVLHETLQAKDSVYGPNGGRWTAYGAKSAPGYLERERHHARRLLDMLHDTATDDSAFKPEEIEAQTNLRWRHELERHGFLFKIEQLKELHKKTARVLVAAAAEAKLLVEHTRESTPRRAGGGSLSSTPVPNSVTADEHETASIMMNNCLAADVILRNVGSSIKAFQSLDTKTTGGDDFGPHALAAKYGELFPNWGR